MDEVEYTKNGRYETPSSNQKRRRRLVDENSDDEKQEAEIYDQMETEQSQKGNIELQNSRSRWKRRDFLQKTIVL